MQFAQKLHSIEEMEKDRVKFYQRFQELDKDQPHLTYKLTYESEGKMRTIPNRIELFVKDWIKQHDRVATHYKIWPNGEDFHFQCYIEQEPYGHIFTINADLSVTCG